MCYHTVKMYPYCGHPALEICAKDAIFIKDGHDGNLCTSFSFYPCARAQDLGSLCIKFVGDRLKYRRQIKAHPDTIVVVSLGNCNISSKAVMGPCKQRAKRQLDAAGNIVQMNRYIREGAEHNMKMFVLGRARNKRLLDELEAKMRGEVAEGSKEGGEREK